jgi:hypothetical protein
VPPANLQGQKLNTWFQYLYDLSQITNDASREALHGRGHDVRELHRALLLPWSYFLLQIFI